MLDPDPAPKCLLRWYIPCNKNSEDKFLIKAQSSINFIKYLVKSKRSTEKTLMES